MQKLRTAIISIALLWGVATANAQEIQSSAAITSPTEGQSLFGLVEITGTAVHPSLFSGFVLEWSNAQNPDVWLPIQQPVSQQVNNGILGQWNTVNVPDGIYQIRLRMFLTDGTTQDFPVFGLQVANAQPTDVPTVPAIIPATPTLPSLSTNDASPTPLISQPPTVTPRPTFEQPLAGAAETNSSSDDESSTFVNVNAAQQAVCNGIFFSMGLFGIIILYLILRSRISPFTRRLWWQIRSELDENNPKDY